MEPIRTIAQLPFRRRDVLDLLQLREHRDAPDPDYTGYGYARADEIHLEGDSPEPRALHGALVLAVHSTEEPEELPGDIELEFFVPEVAADYSVTVLLSAFLRAWLPRVSGDERAIALVVCNPRETRLARPAAAGSTPLYYPLGDVASWLDGEDGRRRVRLVAGAWRLAEDDRG